MKSALDSNPTTTDFASIMAEWDETHGQWIDSYWVPARAIDLLGGLEAAVATIGLLSKEHQ